MHFLADLARHPVRRLPLREAVIVTAATIARAAIAKMRFQRIGCAIVVDVLGKPIGLFSEQSVISLLVRKASLDGSPVGRFLDSEPLVVRTTDPIERVWSIVREDRQRFVCVLSEFGEIVGVTGQRGLAEYAASRLPIPVLVPRTRGSAPTLVIDDPETVPGPSPEEDERFGPLAEVLVETPVAAIRHLPIVRIDHSTTVRDAVRILAETGTACALVFEGERLVGVFTERDVLERIAERFERVADLAVDVVMSSDPLVVHDTDPAGAALGAIAIAGYRHVPVLDAAGTVVGVVSPRRVFDFLQDRLATTSRRH